MGEGTRDYKELSWKWTKLIIKFRILMSTIAPKLSEFATKTYSLPWEKIGRNGKNKNTSKKRTCTICSCRYTAWFTHYLCPSYGIKIRAIGTMRHWLSNAITLSLIKAFYEQEQSFSFSDMDYRHNGIIWQHLGIYFLWRQSTMLLH